LQITNPGGFLEGITLDNLLVHEPKPRNPRLAEAFRRIGLVETTSRGVDKIYMGQLRYGRALPDYTQSDREAIRLTLTSDPSLAFAVFVYEESVNGNTLDLDELLILEHLRKERRITVQVAGEVTQRGPIYAHAVLLRLSQRDFIKERREKQERLYYLSTRLHLRIGLLPRRLRADPAEQENMVLKYIDQYGKITRREIVSLLNITERQAGSLLQRLTIHEKILLHGTRRGAFYTRP
jgi:ATP-dependent DNA helicase RecG